MLCCWRGVLRAGDLKASCLKRPHPKPDGPPFSTSSHPCLCLLLQPQKFQPYFIKGYNYPLI